MNHGNLFGLILFVYYCLPLGPSLVLDLFVSKKKKITILDVFSLSKTNCIYRSGSIEKRSLWTMTAVIIMIVEVCSKNEKKKWDNFRIKTEY